MGAAPGGLSNAQQDAIGYVGGGILAICLIPQVAKVLVTRSARDISISWSVLYSIGLTLSLAYLVVKDATAAWIPIIFEIAGCLLVLCLKLFYEHTEAGRRFSAAKQQQAQELSLDHSPPSSAQGHQHSMHAGAAQPAHSPRGLSALEAAAAVVSSSGDISWRGRAVLGQHQEAPPAGVTVPMIDVSTHGGSRHGGSRHGSRHGSMHGGSGQHSSWPGSKPAHTPASADAMHALHLQDQQGPHHQPPNKQQQDAAQQGAVLEVKCAGTSIGSCSSSSISATQESSRVPALQPQQQQQQQQQQQAPPLEPLFASTWSLQPVAPVIQHHHQQ